MQSKTSFFNRALYKKNISRTWIVGLLYLITLLLCFPVSFVIGMSDFENSWYADAGYTKTMALLEKLSYANIGFFTSIITIIVATITFRYMFSKRDNFMIHGFPVTRKSLYFTGIISSLAVTLVPVIITAIIMTGVAAAEKAYAFDAIWFLTLDICVATVLFMSIAMFALMSSGQLVTAIIFYIIYNYLYLLMEYAFRLTAGILLFGMSDAPNTMDYTPLTPIEYIDQNCGILTHTYYNNLGKIRSFSYELMGFKYLCIYFVVALVIFTMAFYMYKTKKLETVQDFISVPVLKPVFTIGMSFFVSMVAGAFVAGMVDAVEYQKYTTRFTIAIISTIIIGAIIFYATQMLIEKTLRVFSAKTFTLMLGYSVMALVVMIGMKSDVLKVENRIPKAEDIAWVGIRSSYTMVFSDQEEINSVRELHKNFLDDKKELRDVNVLYKDVPGATYTIKYKLKNGKVLSRTYNVVDTESDQVGATYLAATEPIVDYLNNPTRIKQHVIGNIWNNCDVTEMNFTYYVFNENIKDFNGYTERFDYLNDKEKVKKFNKVYAAFLKDVDEGNVFVTRFNDYISYDDNLFNDFSFTVSNEDIPYFSDEQAFWGYGDDETYYSQGIYAQLNKNCVNTLRALKEAEFYLEDSQVITYEEYDEMTGYNDEY